MNISIYENLQQDFIMIRYLFFGDRYDEKLFNKTLDSIKKNREMISLKSKGEEMQLLIYCIDTLIEILDEKNKQKTFDFADTIHNMPEICMGKRNFKSFQYEINTFRKKYGDSYFAPFNDILKSPVDPLLIGIFNVILPVPMFIFLILWNTILFLIIDIDTAFNWLFFFFEIRSIFIFPAFGLLGLIYGLTRRKDKYALSCIILSCIGLIIYIIIFAALLRMAYYY